MSLIASAPLKRQLLLLSIAVIVSIEFLQNAMVSFSSAYISGGVNAAPEEFSLAASVYAGTAIIMISKHRWLVERQGYRGFLRLSLIVFTLGALLCADASTPAGLIVGRFVQALGGSAFFTGARVLVNRFHGRERGVAIRYMASGLMLGSGMAAWLASRLLEWISWRGVFFGTFPLVFIGLVLCELAVEDDDIPADSHSKLHPGGTMLLAAGVFCIQYVFERIPYDFFTNPIHLAVLVGLAVGGFSLFVLMETRRTDSLLPFGRFMSQRYTAGLILYGTCYLTLSSSNYMLPIFLQRGLGYAVLPTGLVLSAAALVSLLVGLGHVQVVPRYPRQKKYLVAAFLTLALFGFGMSQLSTDIARWQLLFPLVCFAVFTALGQGTAALNTFAGVEEDVFSQAYQTKNMLRELLNSSGISIATVLLQSRSTLHYSRLAESIPYARLDIIDSGPFSHLLTGPVLPQTWQQLANLVSQQATALSCMDFFFAVGCLGMMGIAVSLFQRRIV